MTQLSFVFQQAAKYVGKRGASQGNCVCNAITQVCRELDSTGELGVTAKKYFNSLFGPDDYEPRRSIPFWMFDAGESQWGRASNLEVKGRRILALLLAAEVANDEC